MAAIINDKDKILQAAAVRLPQSLGNGIYFSNPSPVFRTLASGGAQPSSYAIEAKFTGQITGTVTWSVVSGTVSTVGISGNTWNLAYGHLGSDSAVISATLVYLGTTYTNQLTVSRISDARSVNLTTTTQSFTYTSAGTVPSPAGVVVTATAYNMSETAYFEFLVGGTSVQNSTSPTLNYTPAAAFSAMPQQITVQLREGSSGSVVVATSTLSMQASKPGVSPVNVYLSKESHVFPANADGSVVSYGNSGTTIRVLSGLTALEYDGVGTAPGTWKIATTSTFITPGAITDSGLFATVADHSEFDTSQKLATIKYTITGKTSEGVAFTVERDQTFTKAIEGVKGDVGATGDKSVTPSLYQWSTVQPGNPSGTSTFTWATGTHSSYTGGNGWQVSVPTNPGTPLIKLWSATKTVSSAGTATTSTLNWSSGYTVSDITQNGAAGAQVAKAAIYQWGFSPPGGLSGSATYTWSSGAISNVPSGWSLAPGNPPSPGMTLYKAEVNVTDTATATTTAFIWTVASVSAVGYAGTNGAPGQSIQGPQGVSGRYAYARINTTNVPVSGTYTVGGDSSPSFTNTWGASFNTSWSNIDPNPSSTFTLYQTDGLYNPVTNQTTWTTPYVSSLKVGNLQAVSTNTGNLTVTGDFKSGTAQVNGSTMTGVGGILKSDGSFAFGNSTKNITFNGSQVVLNGDLVVTGNLESNAATQFQNVNFSAPNDVWVGYAFYMKAAGTASAFSVGSWVQSGSSGNYSYYLGFSSGYYTVSEPNYYLGATGFWNNSVAPNVGGLILDRYLQEGWHMVWVKLQISTATANHASYVQLLRSYR